MLCFALLAADMLCARARISLLKLAVKRREAAEFEDRVERLGRDLLTPLLLSSFVLVQSK
jgi:hypothetical protein